MLPDFTILAMSENVILSDLGIVAVTATLAAIIFDRFNFPVILGYLLVGLILGPFLFDHHFIHDRDTVRALSELGVIFLLFTLGMEFDLKRLQHLVSTSFLALILQTVLMLFIGMQIAPLAGYSSVTGLFLGSLLAISSSMVTIRVLRDQKAMQLPHAQLAIGILILEDILAVLLLVVLSGISAAGVLPWGSAIWSVFLLSVFVVGVFYMGRIIMPGIIKIVHRIGSLELVTLFAVGTALGIGVLAEQMHLSVALGAFVAGSLFTNSKLCDEIEHSIAPIKELFSSVFFVSIGMLINPKVMLEQWPIILLLAILVVFGKIASCGIGLFLAGQKTRSSFRAAVAKSQIGEFSFVIAKLAESMGLADEKLVSIAVGVSFITILTTPIASQNSLGLYEAFVRITPSPLKQFGAVYYRMLCALQSTMERSALMASLKRPFLQTCVSFFLINGVIIAASLGANYLADVQPYPQFSTWIVLLVWVIAAVLVAPFILSIMRNIGAVALIAVDVIFSKSTLKKRKASYQRFIIHLFYAILILLIGGAFLSAVSNFLPSGGSLILFIILIGVLAVVFQRQMIRLNSELEHRFSSSFASDTEAVEHQRMEEVMESFHKDFDWNSLTQEKVIPAESSVSGLTIRQTKLRETTGATIIAISRGQESIYDPNPNAYLFSGDRVVLLGNRQQIDEASHLLKTPKDQTDETTETAFLTDAIYVNTGNFLAGDTLAGAKLRLTHRVTVVGIKRGDNPVMDPDPSEVLHVGDILLIMGKPRHVKAFKAYIDQTELGAA